MAHCSSTRVRRTTNLSGRVASSCGYHPTRASRAALPRFRKGKNSVFEKEREKATANGVPVARRHIFLCAEQTKPKCCDMERGVAAWEFLKKRLKELGLSEQGGILRSKANCLRICEGGPIAVVYPEGAWYRECDPPALER